MTVWVGIVSIDEIVWIVVLGWVLQVIKMVVLGLGCQLVEAGSGRWPSNLIKHVGWWAR